MGKGPEWKDKDVEDMTKEEISEMLAGCITPVVVILFIIWLVKVFFTQ
jgi:hypothetical protein